MDAIGPISEVRARLPEVVDQVQKTRKRYIITRQGKPVAVLISTEELEALELLVREQNPWVQYKNALERFSRWEDEQSQPRDDQKVFRAIGESVDLFLSLHFRKSLPLDIQAIEQMQKNLALLSKNR